ncbi:hypothetical protein DYB25_007241 [Aphanomyces astaci]|nr:hypothetical protein DYB25_007241 [Aphanomyces astaci]RHY20790.1 hypothetical protein DYB36_005102 [Aphanomyces astaci]RHY57482.1 hypothetical protein DYB34_004582 [Aphanomyces astaci]
MDISRVLRLMRLGNVFCSVFQIVAGIGGVFNLIALNVTGALLSMYVVLFGLLFLLFECRLKSMESRIRANFGFLFSYNGRAGFIFFIGFLDFGMGSAMGTVAGILMCLNAFLNLFIMLKHPEFASGAVRKDADPTTGYADSKEAAQAYLHSNPQSGRSHLERAVQDMHALQADHATKLATVVDRYNKIEASTKAHYEAFVGELKRYRIKLYMLVV